MKTDYRAFRGTRPEYDALHGWVRKHLGRPKECENCGTTDANRYEWANISGEYLKDLSDWARLCAMCHRHIDNSSSAGYRAKRVFSPYCPQGHEMKGDNLGYRVNKGYRYRTCRACKSARNKVTEAKRKLVRAKK